MSTAVAPVNNKYILKSLEEEIGLFDRKLAHLQNFETFETEEARLVAAGKLSAKRERLVRTMRDILEPPPTPDPSAKKAATSSKAAAKPRVKRPAQPKQTEEIVASSEAVEPTLAS